MLLNFAQYLPSEVLNYANYPEVYTVTDKISQFQKALEPIMLAVSNYDLGTTDGIYVNIAEVARTLNLSYEISDVLGNAPNVCYDLLLPIRDSQEALNELIFSYRYEKTPIVFDRQTTDLKRLNDMVSMSGEVVS